MDGKQWGGLCFNITNSIIIFRLKMISKINKQVLLFDHTVYLIAPWMREVRSQRSLPLPSWYDTVAMIKARRRSPYRRRCIGVQWPVAAVTTVGFVEKKARTWGYRSRGFFEKKARTWGHRSRRRRVATSKWRSTDPFWSGAVELKRCPGSRPYNSGRQELGSTVDGGDVAIASNIRTKVSPL